MSESDSYKNEGKRAKAKEKRWNTENKWNQSVKKPSKRITEMIKAGAKNE